MDIKLTDEELRDFHERATALCEVVNQNELRFEAAALAAKEAGKRCKDASARLDELLDDMYEPTDSEHVSRIQEARQEEVTAFDESTDKKAERNTRKKLLDESMENLKELIDSSFDSQLRMDFSDEYTDWKLVPVDALDIPKGMVTPLEQNGVMNLEQVGELLEGRIEGVTFESFGWAQHRRDLLLEKFSAKLAEMGEVTPLNLETSNVGDDEYEDA